MNVPIDVVFYISMIALCAGIAIGLLAREPRQRELTRSHLPEYRR